MTEKDTTIFEKSLMAVINELKAPKGQFNKFGGYNFRSAEDIIDAVKPILFEKSLRMKISDTVEQIGNRYYVKATVTVSGYSESDETSGYAREAEEQKGMNDAQITGSSSSYARKYALNGMFDIDDTKDADTNEFTIQQNAAPKQIRNRQEEAQQRPIPMGESEDDVLARAKDTINKTLISMDYLTVDAKRAFITKVLGHDTIDNLNEADSVMDALENEQ